MLKQVRQIFVIAGLILLLSLFTACGVRLPTDDLDVAQNPETPTPVTRSDSTGKLPVSIDQPLQTPTKSKPLSGQSLDGSVMVTNTPDQLNLVEADFPFTWKVSTKFMDDNRTHRIQASNMGFMEIKEVVQSFVRIFDDIEEARATIDLRRREPSYGVKVREYSLGHEAVITVTPAGAWTVNFRFHNVVVSVVNSGSPPNEGSEEAVSHWANAAYKHLIANVETMDARAFKILINTPPPDGSGFESILKNAKPNTVYTVLGGGQTQRLNLQTAPTELWVDNIGGIAFDESGNLLVSTSKPRPGVLKLDANNGVISQFIHPDVSITAHAYGDQEVGWIKNYPHDISEVWITDIAFDSSGDILTLLDISDQIILFSPDGQNARIVAGVAGDFRAFAAAIGGFAPNVVLVHPKDMAVDLDGTILIATQSTPSLLRVDPGSGLVTPAFEGGNTIIPSNGDAISIEDALIPNVSAIDVGRNGNIYVSGGGVIYKWDKEESSIRILFLRTPGPSHLNSIAVDGADNLYFTGKNSIHKYDPLTETVTIVAGMVVTGQIVDGVAAADTPTIDASNLAIDHLGNLFFSSQGVSLGNNSVRAIVGIAEPR